MDKESLQLISSADFTIMVEKIGIPGAVIFLSFTLLFILIVLFLRREKQKDEAHAKERKADRKENLAQQEHQNEQDKEQQEAYVKAMLEGSERISALEHEVTSLREKINSFYRFLERRQRQEAIVEERRK